jgi:hypothetical protein
LKVTRKCPKKIRIYFHDFVVDGKDENADGGDDDRGPVCVGNLPENVDDDLKVEIKRSLKRNHFRCETPKKCWNIVNVSDR